MRSTDRQLLFAAFFRNDSGAFWYEQACFLGRSNLVFSNTHLNPGLPILGILTSLANLSLAGKGEMPMDLLNLLSDREREVVNLVLEGKSNKLIASALNISERTVEFHLTNIYSKCQVSSRTELILKLGDSTVAGQGESSENGDRLNILNWVPSLKRAVSRIGKELKMENSLNSGARSGPNPMTFFESIRVCFTKFAEFNGRASRPEFWWFALFVVLVGSIFIYLHENLGSIFLIAVLLPLLAAGARRLRDSGNSPWWLLFLLAPVAGIITLGIMWAQPPANPLPDDTLPA